MRLHHLMPTWKVAELVQLRRHKRPSRPVRLALEPLEERALLTSLTPIQIRHAYGFDRVAFQDATHRLVPGDGSGATIAIVDAYDHPTIASDLAQFDSIYGLPDPPSFTKVNQIGSSIFPAANRGWSQEIALDVEYAHAMAPGANILLVEADDDSDSNMLAAVSYAASQPGVVAVSMSWGETEYSGEGLNDSQFVTPSGHDGITFLAASGDGGAKPQYPPDSANVVAVGGTSLYLDSDGNYLSESGWKGSGGGISQYEDQPAYQNGVVTQSSTQRTTPDVAFVADPSTGAMVYDSYGGHGLYHLGGTSLACPLMAGLTAIVDQGRSYLFGRSSYGGTDFLNALYNLPQSDLKDIVTGNNGFAAGPGYDLVTGRGTPIVDRFVSGMIGAPVYNPLTGELLICGGGRGSDDSITLSQSGGQLIVHISSSTPLAGSDIPADQTFVFDSSQYSGITLARGDGTTTVNIDDSGDAGPSLVTLSSSTLTGLTLGSINFGTGGVSVLNLTGGDGNNVYTITGTPASQATILNTGAGMDRINIQAVGFPLTINSASGSGADLISVGDPSDTISGIAATVTINAAGTDSLVLDDRGFTEARTLTVNDTMITSDPATIAYSGPGSVTINGGTGGNTFRVLSTSATSPLTVIGGSSSDILADSNPGDTFTLVGSNAGTLSGTAYGSAVIFEQIANLTASGGDTYLFTNGASVSGDIVGGGSSTLDYSAYTSAVIVDLQTGFATGIGGSIGGIATVFGGSGTPAGGGVYNLLIGNGGDILNGGFGRRNILVAGISASTLNGGDGQDLLLGGSTSYDTESGLNAWRQIAAYWAGSDDFATRITNLTSDTGVPILDPAVITGNGGGNILNGNGGLALLYTDGLDSLAGFDPASRQIMILP
jgi:hypothetical protein